LVAISTSGRSRNVLAALAAARDSGLTTLAITGGDGGELGSMADLSIVAPSHDTPRIQEIHILALHLICDLVESRMMATPVPVSYQISVAEGLPT
jgi:DNA-binding MurR/RpiR family transcriptional regulator